MLKKHELSDFGTPLCSSGEKVVTPFQKVYDKGRSRLPSGTRNAKINVSEVIT